MQPIKGGWRLPGHLVGARRSGRPLDGCFTPTGPGRAQGPAAGKSSRRRMESTDCRLVAAAGHLHVRRSVHGYILNTARPLGFDKMSRF